MPVCTQLWRITVHHNHSRHALSGTECFQMPDGDKNRELSFADVIVSFSFEPLPLMMAGQK